jgi:hypothetical protein
MSNAFLAIPWNEAWTNERCGLSKEEIAAECMGLKTWDPPCSMAEPFVHNVVSTSKVLHVSTLIAYCSTIVIFIDSVFAGS